MIERIGWTTGAYGLVQIFRFATNLILARLLAPELFGVMVIVNTFRMGVELLSDIGIGQNIISNKKGEEPDFYNTAWTLQFMRGAILFLVGIAAAIPFAHFYDSDILAKIIPAISVIFLLTGVQSPAAFLIQKRLQLKSLAIFEIVVGALTAIVHIVLAYYSRTIWALVLASIISSVFHMLGTYFLIPGVKPKITISRQYLHVILHFGKWIFLSTLVYFLATNFDRLYLAQAIPLQMLGIYGVARTLADTVSLFVARVGNVLIFPMIAAAGHSTEILREKIQKSRFHVLAAAALAVSAFVASGDVIVFFLYDQRYHAAAAMLPVLALGVWFSILCTFSDSILLGIGRPIYGAIGNTTKLVWLLVGLPLATIRYGIGGAVCVIAAVDMVRYGPLWMAQRREGLSFTRQDVGLTIALLFMIVVWRQILALLGIADGFGELRNLAQLLSA